MRSGHIEFRGLTSRIRFEGVGFRYQNKEAEVLHDISFDIPKGTKVGIVGPSGAGKSSIAELLLRFYDPTSGKIMIDGYDLKNLDINSWRKYIGVVTQDVFLFNDTIKANIAFAKPDATFTEICEAAIKAHAYNFIMSFSQGFESVIGDRGVLLSGGQRQRIAIARAILTNPEILIFDEATSALDSESERVVQNALEEVSHGRTVITIAHRLSTVVDSDKIVVINCGNIVKQGTHWELLLKGGIYSKLVKMQKLSIQAKEEETIEH